MAQSGLNPVVNNLAQLASRPATLEEFGVLFLKATLLSASKTLITSADGKSLVVPFSVSVTPAVSSGPTALDTIECYTTCWKILNHPVYCVSKCTTIHPDVAPEHAPPDDQTLLGSVTPGPPVSNPDLVRQTLENSFLRAETPMEAGVILVNAVLTILTDRADLLKADGSAELAGVATVKLPGSSTTSGPTHPLEFTCIETCYEILGIPVLCKEVCQAKIQ